MSNAQDDNLRHMVVYACDVGSTRRGNFGWAKVACRNGEIKTEVSNSIDECIEALNADVESRQKVSIGFECPLFLPVPEQSEQLSHGRHGEGNRSCFAPAGGYVTALGLQQLAFVLSKLRCERLAPAFDVKQWVCEHNRILFWEAFVSGKAHCKNHKRDAATAAWSFWERIGTGQLSTDVSVDAPAKTLSLVGCVLLWAGWVTDLRMLRQAVIVVKPDKKYAGLLSSVSFASCASSASLASSS